MEVLDLSLTSVIIMLAFVFLLLFILVFILLMKSQEVLCYLEMAREVGFYNGRFVFVTVEYNIYPCKEHRVYLCLNS